MLETLNELAAAAVSALSGRLAEAGKSVANEAAKAAGNRLLTWFKGKLTDDADRGALERLQANPQSQGAQKMLEGALLDRLENDKPMAEELTALLRELGAGDHSVSMKLTQKGDGNVGAQVHGDSNQINIGRRD